MKLNFRPSKVAFLDFETESTHDLKNSTAAKYAVDPSTKILTCVVKVDGTVYRMGPYLTSTDVGHLRTIAAERTMVAHNAPFDAAVWDAASLGPVEWLDTLPCARAAGLPGGLDKLSLALGGKGKDKNGKRLIDMLCILKPGQKPPAVGPAHQMLMDYNVQDVTELEYIYHLVKGFGEPDVMVVDHTINERGVPVDTDLLSRLESMYQENAERFADEFDAVAGGINPKSSKQMLAWLVDRGFELSSSNKNEILKFLAAPDDYYVGDSDMEAPLALVKEALELRRETTGVGRGKVLKAIQLVGEDSVIRDQLVYYGAHTGRWTSRGLQLHNMPHSARVVDVRTLEPTYAAVSAAADAATAETGKHITVSDTLNTMIRRIVKADNIIAADYSAVEARGLAWLAEEPRMMEVYRDPKRSLYLDMGEIMFRRPISKKDDVMEYTVAKSVILGCGYGMSGAKFANLLRLRESREVIAAMDAANIDLTAAVKTYRATYPMVPALWKRFNEAMHAAVAGEEQVVGRCAFRVVGADVHLMLPSGRPIVYRNARSAMMVPAYCKMYNMPEIPVPTVVFDLPRGNLGFLYGSKIVENAVQALCRDLLADALVKCEAAGLTPFLHVHDEIVCDAEADGLDELLRIMSTPPEWAEGMSVMVEGYSGPQWTKKTSGYIERNAMNGRML